MFLVTISCLRCVVVIVIEVGVASKREIRTGELRRLQKWYLPLPRASPARGEIASAAKFARGGIASAAKFARREIASAAKLARREIANAAVNVMS